MCNHVTLGTRKSVESSTDPGFRIASSQIQPQQRAKGETTEVRTGHRKEKKGHVSRTTPSSVKAGRGLQSIWRDPNMASASLVQNAYGM